MPAPFASIERRLRYLRNGEAVNLLFLPSTFGWIWRRAEHPVNWPLRVLSLVVVLYILFQGSLYWHLKLRAICERTGMPDFFRPLFRLFRRSNVVAMVGMGLLIASAGCRGWASPVDVVWSGGLIGFAVVEHVNYYAYQLMHDSLNDFAYLRRYRRLRRAALAVDLEITPSLEDAA